MPSRWCLDCGQLYHNTPAAPGQRCPPCQHTHDQARGTTGQRGYDAAHKRERNRWQPLIDQGDGQCDAQRCRHPTRRITAGEPWDLGHTADRTTWAGPMHPDCNRATNGG